MYSKTEKSSDLVKEKGLNKTLDIEQKKKLSAGSSSVNKNTSSLRLNSKFSQKPFSSSKRNLPTKRTPDTITGIQWAREWDTGKDPVDKWKMNVPELGDATSQGANYFRSSFHPKGPARGGSGPSRQPKSVHNPGFFHDDRFDDIREASPKNNGEEIFNPKNLLPKAIRNKNIASRLSIVDQQPTFKGRQAKKSILPFQNLSSSISNNGRQDNKLPKQLEKSNNQKEQGNQGFQRDKTHQPESLSFKKEKNEDTKYIKKAVRPAYAPAHWNRRRNANEADHCKINQAEVKRLLEQLIDEVCAEVKQLGLDNSREVEINDNQKINKFDAEVNDFLGHN